MILRGTNRCIWETDEHGRYKVYGQAPKLANFSEFA